MREQVKAKRKFKNKMSNGIRFRCYECGRIRVFEKSSRIFDSCFCGGKYERFTSKMKKDERAASDTTRYFLYGMTDGEAVKIGFSKEPEQRLCELQTGNPRTLKLIGTRFLAVGASAAQDAERKIHLMLQPYHLNGEWFALEAWGKVCPSNVE